MKKIICFIISIALCMTMGMTIMAESTEAESVAESADGESAGVSAEGESDTESAGDSGGGMIPSGGSFGDVKTAVVNNTAILIDPNGVSYDESAADVLEIAAGSTGISENGVSGLHLENASVYNNKNSETNAQGITGITFVDVSGTLGGSDVYYNVTESDDPMDRPSVAEGDTYNTVIILDDGEQVFSRQGNEIADGAAVAFGGGTSEDLITIDHVFLWTKGFKRTNLFADDNAEQLVVRNSRIICPGAENYKLGWQALYGGARATLLQNGDCWFYNNKIVTEGWGALSIDSSPNLDLYAVNCKLDVLGGGYVTFSPGDGTVNFYGVKADSAQYGMFITGNSKGYLHSMEDLDDAAKTYYTEEDAAAPIITEDGKTKITADYTAVLTQQILVNSPTVEGYIFAENSTLSTENVYSIADHSHFLNDSCGGTSWFWTEMWRGSTCLSRSSNTTFEFDNVDLISRTGVVFRTLVNWEGEGKDYSISADTPAVGNHLIMRNMDVTGDIRNDDFYRNLYVDMTDTILTGAFISTTVDDWNQMFSVESLEASGAYAEAVEMLSSWEEGTVPNEIYDAEYPYKEAVLDLEQVSANMTMADNGVLNGVNLVMHEGSIWNVLGDSRLLTLTVTDDAQINTEGYDIYINCAGFDFEVGEKVAQLNVGEYSNVVIVAADDEGESTETDAESTMDPVAGDSPEGESAGESAEVESDTESAGGESAGESAEGESAGDSGDSEGSETEDIEVSVTSYDPETIIVLKGAKLLDRDHNGELLDVAVQNGSIIEVGQGLEGDEIIDLTGYTLMPGMIDSHVHIASSASYNLNLLKQFSTHGITSVREEGMLSTLNEEDYMSLIEESNADPASAYLVSCGKYFDEEGGYGTGPTKNMGIIITSPQEAADEVTHKAELGYTQVKVGINSDQYRMTSEEFTAAADTAHENEMYIAAHINSAAHIEELAGYGIDEAAHTPSDAMSDALITRMVEQEIAMNTSGADSYQEIKTDNLKRFYEAGGLITVGTDKMSGYASCMNTLTAQMQVLANAGLSVQEVITCSTFNNAEALGIHTGLLEEGYEADLIAVQGDVDPTFEALLDIGFIMNDGVILQ